MRFQTLAEGRWIFIILSLLTVVSWWLSPWLSLFFLLLISYTLLFFRDPDRPVPVDADAVVAAADGVVADIVEVDEPEVVKTRMQRVGIFLSVFDVHTNRAPLEGRVIYREHREGLCLDALRQGLLGEKRVDDLGVPKPADHAGRSTADRRDRAPHRRLVQSWR